MSCTLFIVGNVETISKKRIKFKVEVLYLHSKRKFLPYSIKVSSRSLAIFSSGASGSTDKTKLSLLVSILSTHSRAFLGSSYSLSTPWAFDSNPSFWLGSSYSHLTPWVFDSNPLFWLGSSYLVNIHLVEFLIQPGKYCKKPNQNDWFESNQYLDRISCLHFRSICCNNTPSCEV